MKQSTPSLPESSLVNYLGQVFHVHVGACSSFDDVLEVLGESAIHVPGLNIDDSPIFIPERVHLTASLYNLREGSTLFQLLDAFISDQYGGAYVVMQDTTSAGRDGLYLLSVSLDETEQEAYHSNITYMTDVWGKLGNPVARMITGGCRLKTGDIMSVVALQLSSISPR